MVQGLGVNVALWLLNGCRRAAPARLANALVGVGRERCAGSECRRANGVGWCEID
jgi:hypothetical protein